MPGAILRIVRKLLCGIWIALVVLVELRASLPAVLYAACPRIYVAQCVNRDRPQMHCNGKCHRMRQIQAAMGFQGPALHESVPVSVDSVWFLESVFIPVSAKSYADPRCLAALDGAGMVGAPDDPPPRTV